MGTYDDAPPHTEIPRRCPDAPRWWPFHRFWPLEGGKPTGGLYGNRYGTWASIVERCQRCGIKRRREVRYRRDDWSV